MDDTKVRQTVTFFIAVGGVVVTILNIWIVAKLAPIAEDLAVISTRVEAIESLDTVPRTEYIATVGSIDRRLSVIEGYILSQNQKD